MHLQIASSPLCIAQVFIAEDNEPLVSANYLLQVTQSYRNDMLYRLAISELMFAGNCRTVLGDVSFWRQV